MRAIAIALFTLPLGAGLLSSVGAQAATTQGYSCAQEIEAVQAKVNSALDAIAATGAAAPESRAALLHHQPTPATIARAEQELGENRGEQALAALARAREADRTGDAALCHSALVQAQRAIGHR